ncbi:lipid-binding protein [Flavivirga aquatica]|uniref:Lipid-binding protein n=1 Tax=Flavivirga aquatica TaxID=1849968 RepID=A0A1E5SID5_9FLAO|nr:YceI family protein [Flavivirga aquatica]OEJ98878.1 lipid-binding protein [Flavivirga aquatica]
MKKKIASIFFMTALTVFVISCKETTKEATTTEAQKVKEVKVKSNVFTANVSSSTIEWKGFKPTGSHNGTMHLKTGSINVVDGKIVGGSFLIDMTSIIVTDIPKEDAGNAKLLEHLKNPDFFNVEKYPTATFEITSLKEIDNKTMVSGNLTLKELKNNVTLPVTISNENNIISLISDTFTIDRTKWNIKYKSKSIFGDLGDKFINDDIELKIIIKATKS